VCVCVCVCVCVLCVPPALVSADLLETLCKHSSGSPPGSRNTLRIAIKAVDCTTQRTVSRTILFRRSNRFLKYKCARVAHRRRTPSAQRHKLRVHETNELAFHCGQIDQFMFRDVETTAAFRLGTNKQTNKQKMPLRA